MRDLNHPPAASIPDHPIIKTLDVRRFEIDELQVSKTREDVLLDDLLVLIRRGVPLAFRSRRHGSSEIYLVVADGTGEWLNLVNDQPESFDDEFNPAWHPTGDLLAIYTDRFLPSMGDCRGQIEVHHLAFIPLGGERFEVQHFDDLAGE